MTLRRTDPGLAALAAAWPTLPDEVRNQIVGLASVASAWPNLPETVQRQIVMTVHEGSDLGIVEAGYGVNWWRRKTINPNR